MQATKTDSCHTVDVSNNRQHAYSLPLLNAMGMMGDDTASAPQLMDGIHL